MKTKQILGIDPLTEQLIEQQKISPSDLWLIRRSEIIPSQDFMNEEVSFDKDGPPLKIPSKHEGPYSTEQLKNESAKNSEFFQLIEVYNFVKEEWESFFDVSCFQRRKPSLVREENLIHDPQFHLIIDEKIKGPFNYSEVIELLEAKEIFINDEASLDAGRSWIKLYQFHLFDRRLEKNKDKLPFLPREQVHSSQHEAAPVNETSRQDLSNIAHLHSAKSQKTNNLEIGKTQKERFKSTADEIIHFIEQRWGYFSLAFVATIGFASFLVFNNSNQSMSSFAEFLTPQSSRQKHQRSKNTADDFKPIAKRQAPVQQISKPKASPTQNAYKSAQTKNFNQTAPQRVMPQRRPSSRRPQVPQRKLHKNTPNPDIDLDLNDPAVQREITRSISNDDGLIDADYGSYAGDYEGADDGGWNDQAGGAGRVDDYQGDANFDNYPPAQAEQEMMMDENYDQGQAPNDYPVDENYDY